MLLRQSTTVPNTSNVSALIEVGSKGHVRRWYHPGAAVSSRRPACTAGRESGIIAVMTRLRTMCPMNCHPTLCGMLVDVEDGRLVAVQGDPDNPDSRGFLCVRGQASREIIGNPARLLHPLIRARRDGELAPRHVGRGARPDRRRACRRPGRDAVGTWSGHGLFANNYGTRVASHLLRRFANLYGAQWWNPTMICWGLGALRPRAHRHPRDEHQGGHGRPRQAHRPVGRQPRLASRTPRGTWRRRAGAAPTSSRSTCARRRRRRSPTRRCWCGPAATPRWRWRCMHVIVAEEPRTIASSSPRTRWGSTSSPRT